MARIFDFRQSALLLGVGTALGTVVMLVHLAAADSEAHLDGLVHVKRYTFPNSTSCSDVYRIDPIGVVFYYNATSSNVRAHGGHHGGDGGWNEVSNGSQDQYFYQHGCIQGPGGGEFADGHWWNDRYHVRHISHYDASEAWLGTYSLGTPHFEKSLQCGHAVKVPDNTWPTASSGFVAGKWELGLRWHNWNNGGAYHLFL